MNFISYIQKNYNKKSFYNNFLFINFKKNNIKQIIYFFKMEKNIFFIDIKYKKNLKNIFKNINYMNNIFIIKNIHLITSVEKPILIKILFINNKNNNNIVILLSKNKNNISNNIKKLCFIFEEYNLISLYINNILNDIFLYFKNIKKNYFIFIKFIYNKDMILNILKKILLKIKKYIYYSKKVNYKIHYISLRSNKKNIKIFNIINNIQLKKYSINDNIFLRYIINNLLLRK